MSQIIGTGKYEILLERCKSLAPVPTAVAHPCEKTALAGAIETFAAQPELAAEMGQRGRTRVLEYFTLEQMALKNEACYYELLGAVN